MKKLAIGVDDFKKLRKDNAYFIDKSMIVEEVIKDASEVLLFPRPRRFGKTLNMSMLNYFFNNKNSEENKELFKGLAITQSPVFEQHQGQYPVISLSLKSCKGKTFDEVYTSITIIISKAFQEHQHILDRGILNEAEAEEFRSIINKTADKTTINFSLLSLCSFLHRYYEKRVFIIIDEYDTPIHEAYLNGFYKDAVDFMRVFLGNALKGNEYLQKGILTGILRVSKESMFSDLNNVMVYSLLNREFSSYFGFTQKDVDEMLQSYSFNGLQQDVKNWYNGYYFGIEEIYNPWSILSFVKNEGQFRPYWLGTSSNALVHALIKDSGNNVKRKIEDVLNNIPVVAPVNENISFEDLESSEETIISFLVQTGYLKALYQGMQDSRMVYQISIPNQELRLIYVDTINKWFEKSIGGSELKTMLKALLANDIITFERIFSKFVLETLSYFNVGRRTPEVERVFQAFLLGMLIGLKDEYEVYSEKESGYGRFDVSVIPKDKSKPAVIMELKSIDPFRNETKDTTLEAALQQIEDRQYETALRQQGCSHIIKVAVTFDGKRVWAKTAE